jgi:hypothetical protein
MFAQRLGMPVYTVVCLPWSESERVKSDDQDLRNHGASPHAEPHTYSAMALDLANFMKQRGLESGVNLVGHSM